ncbi:sugar transferase [Caulobacter sp. DWR1-3-2b1]|uniref:sugar transferase n=1 Tax=Caulobacter sp. DWR1-3-2b1 TaxID=2804670 RepID=UPI003CE8597F
MLVATGLPSETPSVGAELSRVMIDPYKRALDILIAGAALLFFAPVLVLVGVLIRLESRGPMLFRQARGGLNGEAFTIFKFRSMRCEENGDRVVQAARDDDRVTKIGRFIRKTSIDEIPQLLNVLMGDMSIVGPRPHALAHDVEYGAVIPQYSLRFRAKPGLTGLAQIKGLRGGTDDVQAMAARVEADVEYIDGWTFRSDVRILLLTLPHLLLAENAY